MKLIKLNSGLYIIVDDYNTKEDYDSRITKGSVFYKDELKDICVAEYSPASKVSRPVIACKHPYSDSGIKNSNGLAEIDTKQLNELLRNYKYLQVDVKGLADDYVSNHHDMEVRRMYGHYYRTFIAGADAVLEKVGDKKFTLDDIKKAFSSARYVFESDLTPHFKDCDEYIKSIQEEKTEWDIEIEIEEDKRVGNYLKYNSKIDPNTIPLVPKITNGFINILKIK